jgi:opacity protein-like surface antigen
VTLCPLSYQTRGGEEMMKRLSAKSLSIMLLSGAILILTSIACSAEEWSRSGKSELFGSLQFMSGDTSSAGWGLELEVDDSTVCGIGYGYNFNDNLNVNMDLLFGSTDILGKDGYMSIKADSSLVVTDINVDYNILKSSFTPMISAGVGFINFNGDFEDSDFNETDFSYNLGVGFRWNASEHFLVKGCYKATWTKLEDTDDSIMLDGISLSVGYVF